MKLHTLTLRGIGPFIDEHTIDFEQFAAPGLFLLEGPTGSGKSTIVDAIVFALYGNVAGHDTSDERVRSDYLDARALATSRLSTARRHWLC